MSGNLRKIADFRPDEEVMLDDVLRGLALPQKNIPSLYFYDQRGSELFDAITALPEYYPTRTEIGLLGRHSAEMAAALGPGVRLIELGSGSAIKTELLLRSLRDPAAYVPVEISRDHLLTAAARIAEDFPDLEVLPVTADFTEPFQLPTPRQRTVRRDVAFFPGSTIGNFPRRMAADLLRTTRRAVGAAGAMLVGVDLVKDRAVLERAYNDSAGVTAAFNLNLLRRLNRELGADFDLGGFRHEAIWDEDRERIEMRLISLAPQSVRVAGRQFEFAAGEILVTEYSHKYTLAGFGALAADSSFEVARNWTDEKGYFSVLLLQAA